MDAAFNDATGCIVGEVSAADEDDERWATVPRMGYGACSRCACQGYEGNGPVCTNCGHAYDDHW